MLCYGARLSEPFVSYTQRKGTVITMKENQEKKSKLSGLGATLQLGNKPLWKERVSYFFVNLGNIPIMTMVNAYLSIFYTDTLGMDAKVVGTMFLIARVFDGVNDPFIGYFIDRAPNSKFGKFRRILIVGTIICTLNYAVVWMGPAYVSDSMKVIVAYISYMLLGVTFPVMDISLNSMLPVMTNDMEERNFLAMLKNFAYGLGGGLNLIAPIVFAKFNSSVKGYNIMNLLAMGIILSCSLGGITGIHQRVEPLKDAGYKAKDVLRIIKLKPLIAFFFGGLIVQTGLAFVATSNPYYATHALGSIGKLTIMNTVAIVGGPVSLLAVPLAKKIGKRRIYVCGMIVTAIGCLVRLVAVNDKTSGLVAACISSVICSCGTSFAQLLYYSIQADNIDYVDYKLGLRAEGVIAAATSMITKISNGIGAAFSLYVLSWTANGDGSYTKLGLSLADGLIPGIVVFVGAIVFLLLYRINNAEAEKIQAVLSERRETAENET